MVGIWSPLGWQPYYPSHSAAAASSDATAAVMLLLSILQWMMLPLPISRRCRSCCAVSCFCCSVSAAAAVAPYVANGAPSAATSAAIAAYVFVFCSCVGCLSSGQASFLYMCFPCLFYEASSRCCSSASRAVSNVLKAALALWGSIVNCCYSQCLHSCSGAAPQGLLATMFFQHGGQGSNKFLRHVLPGDLRVFYKVYVIQSVILSTFFKLRSTSTAVKYWNKGGVFILSVSYYYHIRCAKPNLYSHICIITK